MGQGRDRKKHLRSISLAELDGQVEAAEVHDRSLHNIALDQEEGLASCTKYVEIWTSRRNGRHRGSARGNYGSATTPDGGIRAGLSTNALQERLPRQHTKQFKLG